MKRYSAPCNSSFARYGLKCNSLNRCNRYRGGVRL